MTFAQEKTSHAYIRVTDMKNHTVNTRDLKYIDEDVFTQIKNYTVAKNDLYITIAGTIGAIGEIPDELDGMNLTENAVKVTSYGVNKSYLCLVLQSELVQKQFSYKTYQVAMPKLGLERILTTLIPVCGSSTQKAICDAITEASRYLEQVNINQADLISLISYLKSKILDLAIQGKLVPQNQDDEPASVLLERIRAEKEELIKAGKIKRDKKESFIFKSDDNSYYEKVENNIKNIADKIPFEIPESWTFVRLEDVLDYEQPTPYIVKSTDYKDDYQTPVLTAGKSFIIGYTNETYGIKTELPVIIFDDFTTDSKYVDFPFKVKSSAMKIITAEKKLINIKFAYYAMQVVECDNYNHKRYWISEFSKKLIPLPPKAEQTKIVKAIEKLYKYIEQTLS